MRLVSDIERHLATGQDGGVPSQVAHCGSESSDAAIALLVPVPLQELLAEGAAVVPVPPGRARTLLGIP